MRAYLAVSLLAAGVMMAQPPGPRARFAGPGGHGPRDFESRLTQNLGLNAEQQNKVHTIMAESRLTTKGNAEQTHSLHASLTEAIKAGDEAKIDKITQELAGLHQQQIANHAKTTAKIYATLSADQKTKVGPNLELLMGGPMGGRRPGPPPAKVQ